MTPYLHLVTSLEEGSGNLLSLHQCNLLVKQFKLVHEQEQISNPWRAAGAHWNSNCLPQQEVTNFGVKIVEQISHPIDQSVFGHHFLTEGILRVPEPLEG